MAQINFRVDDDIKRSAERTLNDIGLNMSTAITIFLKAVVRENRIPFELTADPFYSKENMDELKIKRHQIAAKTYRGVELVPLENIYYFLADQKYVTVRHKNGSVLIDETLKDLESEFGDQFIRIHRNALVSIQFLEGLEVVNSGQYQVRCRELDERLAVSRRHLPLLRERIQKL